MSGCDPGTDADTARLPWFALDTINTSREACLDRDGWYELEVAQNVGMPFDSLTMDFAILLRRNSAVSAGCDHTSFKVRSTVEPQRLRATSTLLSKYSAHDPKPTHS